MANATAKKRGRPLGAKNKVSGGTATGKRRGRPPGSGKKGTGGTATGKPRGRPPGSGKKTNATAPAKQRGRPRGSNKKRKGGAATGWTAVINEKLSRYENAPQLGSQADDLKAQEQELGIEIGDLQTTLLEVRASRQIIEEQLQEILGDSDTDTTQLVPPAQDPDPTPDLASMPGSVTSDAEPEDYADDETAEAVLVKFADPEMAYSAGDLATFLMIDENFSSNEDLNTVANRVVHASDQFECTEGAEGDVFQLITDADKDMLDDSPQHEESGDEDGEGDNTEDNDKE